VGPAGSERNRIARLMNDRKYGEAIAALEALCDSFPEAHDLAELLSTCYLREGRPEEAAALLEKRLAAEPRWTGFARNLGLAYLNLGRREDALRAWRSLLAGEEGEENYMAVADLQWNAGMYEEAVETLTEGALIEEYFISCTTELIRFQRLRGDAEAAFAGALRLAERESNPYGGRTGLLRDIFLEADGKERLLAMVDSLSIGAGGNRAFFALTSALLRAGTGDFSPARELVAADRKPDLGPEEIYYFASALLEMRDQRNAEGYEDLFLELIDLFMEKYPRSPMVPQMTLVAARYSHETGAGAGPEGRVHLEKALELADRILANRAWAAYAEKASLLKGRVLLENLRDPARALSALDEAAWSSPDGLREGEELKVQANLAAGRWEEAKRAGAAAESGGDSIIAAARSYGAAMATFLSGEFGAGIDSLSGMAKRYPWSKWANDALETAVTARLSLNDGGAGLETYVGAVNDASAGRFGAALAALDSLESEAPGTALAARAAYMRSGILLELGREGDASAALEGLAEGYPLDRFAPRALERLGAMAETADPQKASAYYASIIEKYPDYIFMERVRTRYMSLQRESAVPGEFREEAGGGLR
jgi:tetratricopeptide (TPR) repeat protein